MSTRDNVSGAVVAIAGVSTYLATDATYPAAGVDTRGADGAKMFVRTGPFSFTSGNNVEWRLQHSNTTTNGDFVAVEQKDVIGVTVGANGALVKYVDTVAAAGALLTVGYRGPRRYIRLASVKDGTVTNATAQVFSELTYLHREGKTVTS